LKFKDLISPEPLPFEYEEWRSKPFHERVIMLSRAWAIQGYGAPVAVYTFYLLKIAFYIGMWLWFCSFSAVLGNPSEIGSWWFHPEALKKAVLWSMLFESLGMGCGSGPLTARYFPPFAGVLHFLRPGTIKMPLFPGLPLLGKDKRSILDAGLYLAFIVLLVRVLISPEVVPELLYPVVILLPLLALTDKAIFLSARGEHYFIAAICFLFPEELIPASKLVWLSIWIWAATSKLNRHFPAVICVMISNSAFLRIPWLRKKIYKDYPNDLRPGKLAHFLAHFGTIVEYLFPLMLLFGDGGTITTVALIIMVLFHFYITASVPMAVPLEWNIIMVYGGFVLFGHHAATWAFDIHSIPLILALLTGLVALPVLGNLFPKWVSFLVSMRYYAGNWAYNIWLFKKGSEEKLDTCIKKAAPTVMKQLHYFYDEKTADSLVSKVIAFRAMHLHGRLLQQVVPKMVDNIEDYDWRDGELIAGVVLGWNFGDGHLHNAQLLNAIQARCQFEPGELRCLFVEAQPMFNPYLSWQIVDAATGELEQGSTRVKDLEALQPWG
jgi:hypothetical protein